jgi:hypothetical protein
MESNPKAYATLIKEANAALNPVIGTSLFTSDRAYLGVLDEVRKDLGRNIDFANQADREAIGNKLIQHIRETRGCKVTGDEGAGC